MIYFCILQNIEMKIIERYLLKKKQISEANKVKLIAIKKEETASLILLNGPISAIFKVIAWNDPKTEEKANAAIQWCLSCSFLQAF